MNLNYKLFFKYILYYKNLIFFKYLYRNDKNSILFINKIDLYYLTLHIKLSTFFYSTQLVDMFCYDLPLNLNQTTDKLVSINNHNIIVYNFHSIHFQQRFFFFILTNLKKNYNNNFINTSHLSSITELFLNSNWLEREISELHGVFFFGKKDLRNLMLTYGDTSAPMQKSLPSIGLREIFYDATNDLLIQTNVTLQF